MPDIEKTNRKLAEEFVKAANDLAAVKEELKTVGAETKAIAETSAEHAKKISDITVRSIEAKDIRRRISEHGIYTGTFESKGVTWDLEKKEAFLEFSIAVLKQNRKAVKDFYLSRYEKDMDGGTGAAGGYLVPVEFYPEIYAVMAQSSVYWSGVTRIPMGAQKMNYPARDGNWAVEIVDEGAAMSSPAEPTFGNIVLNAAKLMAYGLISSELLEDSAPDIVDFLVTTAGEKFGQVIDQIGFNHDNQTGTVAPTAYTGILRAAGHQVQLPATKTSFSDLEYDNLVAAIGLLSTSRISGAAWYWSPYVYSIILGLRDTANRPLWGTTVVGQPPTILGYPFYLVDEMPGLADDAVSTDFILFGNLTRLMVGDRRNLTFKSTDAEKLASDQTSMLFTQRIGWADISAADEVANNFVRITTAAS